MTKHGRRRRTWGRVQRAWHELTGPLPADERSTSRRRARDRQMRRLRRERVFRRWARQTRSIDPSKQPIVVLRWFAVLGLALAWWAEGAATSPTHKWLPYAVVAAVLILPDIAGFAVGGFRLDLKEAQDEIARLHQEVNAQARASSISVVALGGELDALQALISGAIRTVRDQSSGPATPWPPSSGSGTQP